MDDALRAPDGLPWTTLRVAHRADLRPQAPQAATTKSKTSTIEEPIQAERAEESLDCYRDGGVSARWLRQGLCKAGEADQASAGICRSKPVGNGRSGHRKHARNGSGRVTFQRQQPGKSASFFRRVG